MLVLVHLSSDPEGASQENSSKQVDAAKTFTPLTNSMESGRMDALR